MFFVIKIRDHFKGAERIAFYGLDMRHSPPLPIVLKEYIRVYSKNLAKRFETSSQVQTIVAFMADQFCSALSKKINSSVDLKFIESKTIAIGKGSELRYLSYERRFNSDKFVRLTNNVDYQISTHKAKEMKIPSKIIELVTAFSHWSHKVDFYHPKFDANFQATMGKIMVVDLQGIIENSCSELSITLTDPAILSADPTRFGAMNTGKQGMIKFLRAHKCNQFCKSLNLQCAKLDIYGVE